MSAPAGPAPGGGRVAENLVRFVRTLRRVGVAAGPADTLGAVGAVRAVGLRRRDDLYWALRASLVRRPADADIFDEAFRALWEGIALAPEGVSEAFGRPAGGAAPSRRLAEALGAFGAGDGEGARPAGGRAALAASARERLGALDIAGMGAGEERLAREQVRRLARPLGRVPTRRRRPHAAARGGIDLAATLRAAVRTGGVPFRLVRRRRRTRPPGVVVLCDISGSMAAYTRMLLHFMHALGAGGHRVHSFVFGTRLTNVTRALRIGDPDRAVRSAAGMVRDWSGGTRIGAALRAFNRLWSRRVLAQGAVVLLVSDGLERDPDADLAGEAARLRRSCRRLVWLNPLLRFAGFEPRAAGMAALRPHVDELRPVHTLDSLRSLADALAAGSGRGATGGIP